MKKRYHFVIQNEEKDLVICCLYVENSHFVQNDIAF